MEKYPAEMAKETMLLDPSLQEKLPKASLQMKTMEHMCFVFDAVSDEWNCEFAARNGYAKHYVDMSQWDNYKICQDYLEYWRGKPM